MFKIYFCASVDNHIPRDDILDYHPLRECNIYIISPLSNAVKLFSMQLSIDK